VRSTARNPIIVDSPTTDRSVVSRAWVGERNRERSNANARAYGKTEAGRAVRKAAHYKRRGMRLRDVDEIARGYLSAIANDPCAYCGGLADTVDHKQPLSRGGSNEWWNLTAACRSCNSRKHNKTVEEFLTAPSLPTPGLGQLEETA
jgi:5-methylcytosine-specific restriction endonuclease McrA